MKRPWLLPLNPLYRAAVAVKNHAYAAHRLPVRRLGSPVVSVGSVSAGGAGKTPAVLALAGLLERNGYAVDVLSRGYRRSSKGVLAVDPAGPADTFGDEPVELARAGLNVFVGADRYEAGLAAELAATGGKPLVHLLDDGFQHRRLGRTFDIAVLTLTDLDDHLLPAGNLREPLQSLRRADAVLVREEEAEAIVPVISRLTRALPWVLRRKLVLPPGTPTRPFVFTGIARPESFLASLEKADQPVAGHVAFPDHHPYTAADCARLVAAARAAGANGFVTTGKDVVKLPPALLAQLGSVSVARLESTFLHEHDQVRRPLLRALESGGGSQT